MRLQDIKSLESLRNSSIILLVSGMQEDVLEPLARHLEAIEEPGRLSLFLRTGGGDTTTAFNIVNMIKQYFKEFEIIIPTVAHSAGTLLSLGASKLVMTKQASLSPFDPSVRNDRINNGMNISWRDMNYFMTSASMSNSEVETKPLHALIESQVHPLLIGHAERTVAQIRTYAPILIGNESSRPPEEIIHQFLESNTHHNYRFYRDEVERIGLSVVHPTKVEEKLILSIFDDIAKELDLNNHDHKRGKVKALIESTEYGKTLFIHTEDYEGWVDESERFRKAKKLS
ncbi:SDH family Clp fold serine proteinase [Sutcliffiella deserti]|uniref:SDH family Clp fold serine proteinase n=1 Tax=Sutcliffiella deserti TaxID=2875501 RepID=UPI001CBB844E|nr:ATP-dependent Clp protease proteolytic subunit [Sutcliffiella deserti]